MTTDDFNVREDWEATRDEFVARLNQPPPRPTSTECRHAAEERWPPYPAMTDQERRDRHEYIEHVAATRPRAIPEPRSWLRQRALAALRPLWPYYAALIAAINIALVVISVRMDIDARADEANIAASVVAALLIALVPSVCLAVLFSSHHEHRRYRTELRSEAYYQSLNADRALYRAWQFSNRAETPLPNPTPDYTKDIK